MRKVEELRGYKIDDWCLMAIDAEKEIVSEWKRSEIENN